MWFGETPSSSIVCDGHLAALLMPISAYAGQAMAQWPPTPQAIMFGFTQWKGLIGSAHAPDWTCFTPVGPHRIKGNPSPPGAIIRTHIHFADTHRTVSWNVAFAEQGTHPPAHNLHKQHEKRCTRPCKDPWRNALHCASGSIVLKLRQERVHTLALCKSVSGWCGLIALGVSVV